jgi:hypothetical protein
MPFVVERVTAEIDAAVFSPENIPVIRRFGSVSRGREAFEERSCVLDRGREACLLMLCTHDVMDGRRLYLLWQPCRLCVLEVGWDGCVGFLYMDPTSMSDVPGTRRLVEDAFVVGGRWCHGISNEVVDFIEVKFQ